MPTKADPKFAHLFTFRNEKEKLRHMAAMVSYRFLSEIEKYCDKNNISHKELAEKVGTSAGYISQLFRGNRQINTAIIAKFENALGITFTIKALKSKRI